MCNPDRILYLQRNLYSDNVLDSIKYYLLFNLNRRWIVNVCRNEFDLASLTECIDIDELYNIALCGLSRSILEFDDTIHDIDTYYYDYLKKYLTREIAKLLDEDIDDFDVEEEDYEFPLRMDSLLNGSMIRFDDYEESIVNHYMDIFNDNDLCLEEIETDAYYISIILS